MKSCSQFKQDLFVYHILGNLNHGYFIDVGAKWPQQDSNSYMLEQLGWKGVCVDNETDEPINWTGRKADLIRRNAQDIDWELLNTFGRDFQYLSIDADADSYLALESIVSAFDGVFSVVTVEHDEYVRGTGMRDSQRELMEDSGYHLLCPEVFPTAHPEIIWEDWWIWEDEIDSDLANKVRGMRSIDHILEVLGHVD